MQYSLRSIPAAIALALACALPVRAERTAPVELRILAINDFHGNLRPPPGGIRIGDPEDKTKKVTVAAGGVDLALNQIAEIVADARLELVGPLPEPYQRYTNYAAGVLATSRNQSASKEFIAFMATPEAAAIMRRRGFEPN